MADLNNLYALKMRARVKLAERLAKVKKISEAQASNEGRALLDKLTRQFGQTTDDEQKLLEMVANDPDPVIKKFAGTSTPAATKVAPATAPAAAKVAKPTKVAAPASIAEVAKPAVVPTDTPAPKAPAKPKSAAVKARTKPTAPATPVAPPAPAAKPAAKPAAAPKAAVQRTRKPKAGTVAAPKVAPTPTPTTPAVVPDNPPATLTGTQTPLGPRVGSASRPYALEEIVQMKSGSGLPAPAEGPKGVPTNPGQMAFQQRSSSGATAQSGRTLRPNPGVPEVAVSPEAALNERAARRAAAKAANAERFAKTPAYRARRAAKAQEAVGQWAKAADAAEEAAAGYSGARSVASTRAAAGARSAAGVADAAGTAAQVAGKGGKLAGLAKVAGRVALPIGIALTAWELGRYGYGLATGNRREGEQRGLQSLGDYQENTRQEMEMQNAERLNSQLRRIESDRDLMMSRMMSEREERITELAGVVLRNEGSIRAAAVPSRPGFAEIYAQMKGGM